MDQRAVNFTRKRHESDPTGKLIEWYQYKNRGDDSNDPPPFQASPEVFWRYVGAAVDLLVAWSASKEGVQQPPAEASVLCPHCDAHLPVRMEFVVSAERALHQSVVVNAARLYRRSSSFVGHAAPEFHHSLSSELTNAVPVRLQTGGQGLLHRPQFQQPLPAAHKGVDILDQLIGK